MPKGALKGLQQNIELPRCGSNQSSHGLAAQIRFISMLLEVTLCFIKSF